MRKKRELCESEKCHCAACRGVPDADLVWGFDPRELRKTLCFHCKKPIGRARYVLDAGLARFGTLLVEHRRCVSEKEAADMDAKALKLAKRQGRLKAA